MRWFWSVVLLTGFGLANLGGCSKKPFDGPTVDAFNGKVTQDGKPVSFPEDQEVSLELVHHQSTQTFGIPLKPDGSFKIGWMPIGKYSVTLERVAKGSPGPARKQSVPGGLTIVDGQTEYTIDLGKSRKP
jgi:hypothetical protein